MLSLEEEKFGKSETIKDLEKIVQQIKEMPPRLNLNKSESLFESSNGSEEKDDFNVEQGTAELQTQKGSKTTPASVAESPL